MLQNEKNDRYGEKQEVATQLNAQVKETKKKFSDHVATAKLAFRDDPATLAKFKVSRIALQDSPQLLEVLGIAVKSGKVS